MEAAMCARAAVLAIGELDSTRLRNEYQAIVATFRRLGAELIEARPATDESMATEAVRAAAEHDPELLLLVPLRGLSARAMEAAAAAIRTPVLVWPVEGRFALPSSTLAVGALRQSGHRVELLFAPPALPAAIHRARCFMRAAHALARLGRCRIGAIGELFPNLISCRYDPQLLRARLGVTIVSMGFDAVREAMQRIPPQEIARMRCDLTAAKGRASPDSLPLEPGIRLHLALKQIATDNSIDGFAPECWSGLPRALGLNPCLGFIEDAYAIACEGDVQLCVALLALRWLCGSSAYAGDLADCDLKGTVTLVHCGAPASLARHRTDVVLRRSRLAEERGFQTVTCRPPLASGPATLFRLNGSGCDSLHLAEARIVGCETHHDLRVRLRLRGDRWDFLRQCLGNHYIVAAGDVRQELRLLADWCGIEVRET